MAEAATSSSTLSSTNVVPSVLNHQNNNNVVISNINSNSNAILNDDENQLSNDLEQFLLNPSLRNALMDGSLDLKSYSDTIEYELQQLEQECITIYRNHTTEIQQLQKDLAVSSNILKSLYEMLLGFQYDIGNLSDDIRTLQSQSSILDVQLQNRKSVESLLSQYIQHIIIAPTIVQTIMKDPVNSINYVKAVQEIQQIYMHCSTTVVTDWSCSIPVRDTLSAGQEMLRECHSLRNIAVKRIREYFLQQLHKMMPASSSTTTSSSQQHYGSSGNATGSTNIRLLQVHFLLKYQSLYDFLEDYYYDAIENTNNSSGSNSNSTVIPNIANEIYTIYVEIMCHTLKQLFRTYSQQLLSLDCTKHNCTRIDVIAIEDTVLRESVQSKKIQHQQSVSLSTASSSSSSFTNTNHKVRMDPFTLNRRAQDVLGTYSDTATSGTTSTSNMTTPSKGNANNTSTTNSNVNSKTSRTASPKTNTTTEPTTATAMQFVLPPRINVHVSLLQKEQYPYERLYGSIIGHLLDAVTNEHVFCRQFFKRSSSTTDTFTVLFGPTISLLLEHIENYLFTCYDIICLLLMIQITHSVRRVARQRKIYALEPFLDQILHLLWPRIKIIMDNHTRSIQQATAISLAVTDMHPHYISRRFGEFCCSVLLIVHHTSSSTDGTLQRTRTVTRNTSDKASNELHHHQSAGSRLLQDLSVMIDSYIQLLERVSEIHTTQKKRIVFLINNLDHVICIFQERRVSGKECNMLLERLLKFREDFVEEELLTGFSKMIAFIQQTEAHMAATTTTTAAVGARSNSNGDYDVNASVVESLVLDFASNWRSNIDQINRNVLSYFSNFRNGMEILKHCLTQLLLYYTRFQDIIRKVWKKSLPAFTKDLISTNVILAEIKKYALAI